MYVSICNSKVPVPCPQGGLGCRASPGISVNYWALPLIVPFFVCAKIFSQVASSHLFFTFGSARAAPTSKSLKKIQTKKFRQKNSDEKIPTKKFRRKNLDEKIPTKKNWGQSPGARHGCCGGKAQVIIGDSWRAKPPRPPPGGQGTGNGVS